MKSKRDKWTIWNILSKRCMILVLKNLKDVRRIFKIKLKFLIYSKENAILLSDLNELYT